MILSSFKVIDRRRLTISLLCYLVVTIPAAAQQSAGQEYFTDVVLVNQHGEDMRLYSDVLKGNVVVINSFFATCEDTCPVINGKLAAFQERLGDRLGSEILLISITIDPITDTPGRLKAYAEKFNARSGWLFLSGQKENVDHALSKFGLYVDDKNAHKSIVLVGNEPTGLWKKAFGLGKTEELFKVVESVLNDNG